MIVGTDSAGCVLARRLAADSGADVLLLEAGEPDEKEEVHVRLHQGRERGRDVDWDYSTTPLPGLGDREECWPRG